MPCGLVYAMLSLAASTGDLFRGLAVMATDRGAVPMLTESVEAIEALGRRAVDRERAHAAAARAWLNGDFAGSIQRYGEILLDYPHDLLALREELRLWEPALLERPQLVAATKRDAMNEHDPLPVLAARARELGLETLAISAVSGRGLPELKRRLLGLLTAPDPPMVREERA